MSDLFPQRPRYAKERALFGYPVLAAFVLFFAFRLAAAYLPLDLGALGSAVLTEVVCLLAPILLFLFLRGRGAPNTLRLHRLYAAHIPLLLAAFVALCSGTLLLSALFGGTDTLGNTVAAYATALPATVPARLLAVPVLAILPAVLEELLFRGFLGAELTRRGVLRTAVVGSLLFSLIHFDLANLPAYLFAGVLLTLSLYATDTLFAPLLLRVLFDLAALLCYRYANAVYRFTGSVELFWFFTVLVFLVSLLLFALEASRLYRARVNAVPAPRRDIPLRVQFYTMLDASSEWPVLLSVVIAIVGIIVL